MIACVAEGGAEDDVRAEERGECEAEEGGEAEVVLADADAETSANFLGAAFGPI